MLKGARFRHVTLRIASTRTRPRDGRAGCTKTLPTCTRLLTFGQRVQQEHELPGLRVALRMSLRRLHHCHHWATRGRHRVQLE